MKPNIHIINTDKFKSNYISIKFAGPLKRETASIKALLSMLMHSGTKELPSQQKIATYLETMYGANVSCSVSSKGQLQVLSLNSICVNDHYLVTKEGLFQKQLQLMKDILFSPNFVNGTYQEHVVIEKRRELKERLIAMKEDKMSYALDKTLEIMGENTALSISSSGYIEDLDAITPEMLSDELTRMIENDMIDVYAVGHFEDEDIKCLEEMFDFHNMRQSNLASYLFKPSTSDIKNIVETQQISQAKYIMGFLCDAHFNLKSHYAMTVFNGILGGFSHSRLFKNVREKNSLCYYITSTYDSFNGIMVVLCGIDAINSDTVYQMVLDEIQDIASGNISDTELAITKGMFFNGLRKAQDEAGSIVSLQYNRDVSGKVETVEEYIENLNNVTKQDIIDVAKTIVLNITFLLKGE